MLCLILQIILTVPMKKNQPNRVLADTHFLGLQGFLRAVTPSGFTRIHFLHITQEESIHWTQLCSRDNIFISCCWGLSGSFLGEVVSVKVGIVPRSALNQEDGRCSQLCPYCGIHRGCWDSWDFWEADIAHLGRKRNREDTLADMI